MKLTPEQIHSIVTQFKSMNSKSDFISLLNLAKTFIYGEKAVGFEEKQLNYYININTDRQRYVTFKIKKKSGGERTISAPIKGLKEFQKAMAIILQCVFSPHEAATGFVWGKSIVDNAKPHIRQNYVYNLDLKDFFPSVDKSRVWGRLLVAPFNLQSSAERKKIANMIAAIVCTGMEVERLVDGAWIKVNKSVLPQGAPTSPVLTNAICERLDIRLNGVARRFGLNYTRYADDITFSSMHNTYDIAGRSENIYVANSTFDNEVRRIISDQNFHVKESKVRLQKPGYRQEVTGLIVNDKANVSRRYVKQVRQWLFNWETYGYEKAYEKFLHVYIKDKGHVKNGAPNMAMVIEGKLLYLKMVKGQYDTTYIKLAERLKNVSEQGANKASDISSSLNIVELIFEVGLEKAMKNFYDEVI